VLGIRRGSSGRATAVPTIAVVGLVVAAAALAVASSTARAAEGPPGNAGAKKLLDVPIGTHPTKSENESTVAANPRDKQKLVAGSHFHGPPAPVATRCVAYTSSDGGETWSAPVALPHPTDDSRCSDPVLAYNADGSRVYYAYLDIRGVRPDGDFDILVSYSDDDGKSWSAPVVALDGGGGLTYDKPWIGTPHDEANYVYVTATRFGGGDSFTCDIVFTRSADSGRSYAAPDILDSSGSDGCDAQGSRPAGGTGGEVLVAWYQDGPDDTFVGSFEIRTRRSADHGATFDETVVAARDDSELQFRLGPFGFYHRWWGGMWPDLELGPRGDAHIVYTHDPVPGSATAEEGDIRYITSSGPPHTTWSAPVTINDDGLERAQGYPAIEIEHEGGATTVHAIWEDHRTSPNAEIDFFFRDSSNRLYDMFYARLTPGASGWTRNIRISETSSVSDSGFFGQPFFIGDYNDLTVSNKLYAVWTDRRDKSADLFDFGVEDPEDDVYGGAIIAGGAAP
jgi:hypothetical protein